MDRQQLPTAGENPVDMILKRYGDVESHRRYRKLLQYLLIDECVEHVQCDG